MKNWGCYLARDPVDTTREHIENMSKARPIYTFMINVFFEIQIVNVLKDSDKIISVKK